MEDIDPDFSSKVKPGDIMVAGKNFGCGSSREHAPMAIKSVGISCVIAVSFARIFFRNAVNIGLPILEVAESDQIKQGELLLVDLSQGLVTNSSQNLDYKAMPLPEFLQDIFGCGGLINYIKSKESSTTL